MTTGEILNLFLECCDDEISQYSIGQPFINGNKLYATDGIIIVSTDLTEELNGLFGPMMVRRGRLPNPVSKIASRDHFEATPVELPEGGGGHDCPRCVGTGWGADDKQCWVCRGNGGWVEPELYIGGVILSGCVVEMLYRHGIREFYRPVDIDNPETPVYFERDQMRGVLMRRIPEKSDSFRPVGANAQAQI
jgi:hypothetical protein